MSEFAALLQDCERAGSRAGSERALSSVTDLFCLSASRLGDDHVELFDAVFGRFLTGADEEARAVLAERLASVERGPAGTIRRLAHDEIVVARPVLALSVRLDDQDLIAVAVARGRDHMLAICDRPGVSAPVTDVLVARGDAVVHHAIVANPGARFSPLGCSTLVGLARTDTALLGLLGERGDLPEAQAREIVVISQHPSSDRVVDTSPWRARQASSLDGHWRLTEDALCGFARARRTAELIDAIACLTGLRPARVETLLSDRDDDLLVVVGRARGWSFETVRTIMSERIEPAAPRALAAAEQSFANLSASTAGRILHFVRLREGQPATVRRA